MTIINPGPVLSIGQGDYESPIGVKADNVYIVEDGVVICSLLDFYREWKDFKNSAKFLQYKDEAPESWQVKLWYDVSIDNAADISYPTGNNSDPDAPQDDSSYAENMDLPQENNG